MTVRELIEQLQTFPPDAPVVIDMCSECQDLYDRQVAMRRMKLHNGYYLRYNERHGMTEADLIDVCHFPGN